MPATASRRNLAVAAALFALLLQAGCASLPDDVARTPSSALTHTADTPLGLASARLLATHPGQSGALLLASGSDAFVARLALADAAQRCLDIQYYIWHGDATGKLLLERILQAAARGVRVRLLLDDIGTAADDHNLLAVDSHPSVEVRLFNPSATRRFRLFGALTDFSRVNRRMHNKSFTADNQVMIVGGRNIGDEYFEARPDVEFADLDVLAIGPVVGEVSAQFDRYWNSPLAFPISALSRERLDEAELQQMRAALRDTVQALQANRDLPVPDASRLAGRLTAGDLPLHYATIRAVADEPDKVLAEPGDASGTLLPQLLPEFAALASELVLVSPYFIPGEAGVERLRALVRRGVRVRVLTNSLASTDVPAVYAGYRPYREALVDAGVELHEFKPTATHATRAPSLAKAPPPESRHAVPGSASGSSRASLHAKSMAFDRRALFVGSMNLDPRSVFTNTETGIVIEHGGLAAAQVAILEQRLDAISYRLQRAPAAADGTSGPIEWVAIEDGREIRHASEPLTTAWQRFKVWLLSLLPVEPLL